MSDAPFPPDVPVPGSPPAATAPTEPGPPVAASGPSWQSWLVAGGVATVLAVGVGYVLGGGGDDGDATAALSADTAAASADGTETFGAPNGGPQGAFGRGTGGTITAIDGGTLTLDATDPSGETSTVTVETTDETTVSETVDGTVDDLAEGDQVLVIGETTDDGVTAASVVDNGDLELTVDGPGGGTPPDGFEPPADGQLPDGTELPDGGAFPGDGSGGAGGLGGFPTAGTITAVDDTTLTVETAAGETVTITLTDDTTISVTEERSLDDLAEGDTIQVTGETSDDVVTATAIRLGDLFIGPMGGPPADAAGSDA